MIEYLNFDIQLDALEGGRYLADARGPGGEARASLAMPSAELVQAMIGRLADGDPGSAAVEELGRRLFEALFPTPIRGLYAASRALLGAGQGLRLHLRLTPGDPAASWPWEFLCDPERGPLALRDAPLVRSLPQGDPLPTLAASLPLKVLLTAAQTPPMLEVERELAAAQVALRALGQHVELVVEPHLTARKLRRQLEEGCHIWHFVGHGGLDQHSQSGGLWLEDALGDPQFVGAGELSDWLYRRGVRLVVLSACGADAAPGRLGTARSVAQSLAAAQVAAVVAMQFSVPQETTRAFAEDFYDGLVRGLPIDACVTRGRAAVCEITGRHSPDWGMPVLYSRVPEAVIIPELRGPAPGAGAGSQLHMIEVGLAALNDLLAGDKLQAGVASFERDFTAVQRRIDVLAQHKRLHDHLQQLESRYGLIQPFISRGGRLVLPEQIPWEALESGIPELVDAIEGMLDLSTPGSPASGLWAAQLERARAELQAALADHDHAALAAATERIERVLSRELSQVNTRMVAAAAELQLGRLAQALAELRDLLAGDGPDPAMTRRFAAVDEGLAGLVRLEQWLGAAVEQHHHCQQADDELRWIESQVARDTGELSFAWPSLRPRLASLYGVVAQAAWAGRLQAGGADLDAALEAGDIPRALRAFRSVRSLANRGFNQIDKNLLDLCEQLQRVGEPLAVLLRTLVGR